MEDKSVDPLARLRGTKKDSEQQVASGEAARARRVADVVEGRKWAIDTAYYDDLVFICSLPPFADPAGLLTDPNGLPEYGRFRDFQEGAAQVLHELRAEELQACTVKEPD